MFISGRQNCHLKGLNSYVIRDRVSPSSGMVRVFHNTGDCVPSLLDWEGRYWLAPHNHRQDITLSALTGRAYNVSFAWDSRAQSKTSLEWIFRSEILGEGLAAHWHDAGELRMINVEPILDGLFIGASEIHTVIAEPGAAWLVREGQVAPVGHKSLCYSTHSPFVLSLDGLYSPLDRDELRAAYYDLAGQSQGRLEHMFREYA